MKNKTGKQNSKTKESVSGFGCDLTEHLKNSGQDVPQVLKCCAEFIEKHGIVDGIYRLSGITSNIQRLRQEFGTKLCPDLTKEVYLQDIHCVGSLCKLYFRELPNPLLTYELYKKFMDTVSIKEECERLQCIQDVINELPPSHYRTLEYLTKHLTHLAAFSAQTNMHARNLALVWAPNLLRPKENEVQLCNGDSAFLEVRLQQMVVEFILNNMEHIFSCTPALHTPCEKGRSLSLEPTGVMVTIPAAHHCAPMKLMSLEEARARSMNAHRPAQKELRQENDMVSDTPYHTVIDLPNNKIRYSGKSKKWKNIFGLGGSVTDTKKKLHWNGSMFIRAQKPEKATIRPAKSMDSLCSLTKEDGEFRHPKGANGLPSPAYKSHTLDSNSSFSLTNDVHEWRFEPDKVLGATAADPNAGRADAKADSPPQQRKLPEQLKVFKGDDHYHHTSPKNRRMLYSGNGNGGSGRTSFPGKLFPLDPLWAHQCKALNISEPFAVSVPLRVSAVISTNSTLCRPLDRDRLPRPVVEAPHGISVEQRDGGRGSGSGAPVAPVNKEDRQAALNANMESHCRSRQTVRGENLELKGDCGEATIFQPQEPLPVLKKDDTERSPSGPSEHQLQASVQLISSTMPEDNEIGKANLSQVYIRPVLPEEFVRCEKQSESLQEQHPEAREQPELDDEIRRIRMDKHWQEIEHALKMIRPDVDLLQEESKSNTSSGSKTSFHAYSTTSIGVATNKLRTLTDSQHADCYSVLSDTSANQITFSSNRDSKHNTECKEDLKNTCSVPQNNVDSNKEQLPLIVKSATYTQPMNPECTKAFCGVAQSKATKMMELPHLTNNEVNMKAPSASFPENLKKMAGISDKQEESEKMTWRAEEKNMSFPLKTNNASLSQDTDKRPQLLDIPDMDDEDSLGDNAADLELEEPWEDYYSAKQWVTSPLHSPKTLNFLQSPEELPSHLTRDSDGPKKDLKTDNQVNLVKTNESSFAKSLQVCHRQQTDSPAEKLQCPDWANSKVQEMISKPEENNEKSLKEKNNYSYQTPKRQRSHDVFDFEKTKNSLTKQRPYSLNLNLGWAHAQDNSGRQSFDFLPGISLGRRKSATKHSCSSLELEMFLSDHQAPMRRNSAPVSVSSVRTSFMIKMCQAKAVPVIPPKVQYSHIPQQPAEKENSPDCGPGREPKHNSAENRKKNKDPTPLVPFTRNTSSVAVTSEQPIKSPRSTTQEVNPPIFRKNSDSDAVDDCAKPGRPTVMQRPSIRVRPKRPQSLILYSPRVPVMDCQPAGDDSRLLLSPIKSPTEILVPKVLPEGPAQAVPLRNKMTMPKSGQRLETSTSCFYQPQRRSMVFDSRSNR